MTLAAGPVAAMSASAASELGRARKRRSSRRPRLGAPPDPAMAAITDPLS